MSDAFITIARVVKTQGLRGEVAAELFTDFPERFAERRRLTAWLKNGERRDVELEDFWPHKGGMVLKFAGVDSIEDAEKLKGAEIQIPSEQRAELEDGAVYVSDLIGCAVSATSGNQPEKELGEVADVIFGAGEAPLLQVKQGAKEYLIPWVERFVRKQDLKARRIEMELPEGMLELDAPLSRKEKDAAQRGEKGE